MKNTIGRAAKNAALEPLLMNDLGRLGICF